MQYEVTKIGKLLNSIGLGVSDLAYSGFGIRLVTGAFGAGKTKNVFKEAYIRKLNNPNGLIIGNVPYDIVDIHFNTMEDLQQVFVYLSKYFNQTNTDDYLQNYKFRPILFIIDEAHIYYFSRNFKGNMQTDSIITNTQCRKREITISYITQDLAQLDVFMRRLSPNVTFYRSIFGIGIALNLYYKVSEATDIGDEYSVELESWYLIWPDRYYKKFFPFIKSFYDQRFRTKFIIGYTPKFKYSYQEFYDIISPIPITSGQENNGTSELPRPQKPVSVFHRIKSWVFDNF